MLHKNKRREETQKGLVPYLVFGRRCLCPILVLFSRHLDLIVVPIVKVVQELLHLVNCLFVITKARYSIATLREGCINIQTLVLTSNHLHQYKQ